MYTGAPSVGSPAPPPKKKKKIRRSDDTGNDPSIYYALSLTMLLRVCTRSVNIFMCIFNITTNLTDGNLFIPTLYAHAQQSYVK